MTDQTANSLNWTSMKVLFAWLFGWIGVSLNLDSTQKLVGIIALLCTIIFTALQTLKLYRELFAPKKPPVIPTIY